MSYTSIAYNRTWAELPAVVERLYPKISEADGLPSCLKAPAPTARPRGLKPRLWAVPSENCLEPARLRRVELLPVTLRTAAAGIVVAGVEGLFNQCVGGPLSLKVQR